MTNRVASIVIPLLSQEDPWLNQCIRSALCQTVDTDVIVVTSPRTPESNLAVLDTLKKEWPALQVIERQPGSQFAEAINEGWQLATTTRVGLLLSDDWLSPTTVERCLEFDADIVCTGHRGFSACETEQFWSRVPKLDDFHALDTLEKKASYLTHFFLYNREAVLAAGGVDPHIGLTGPDDYDLPWTMLERGATVAIVSEALYQYRDHQKQRLTLRSQKEQIANLRGILAKHGICGEEAERLVEEKQRWYGIAVSDAIDNPEWYKDESAETLGRL